MAEGGRNVASESEIERIRNRDDLDVVVGEHGRQGEECLEELQLASRGC